MKKYMEPWPTRLNPITRTWSPNLAFKYRTSAEFKRAAHKFNQVANYKERQGGRMRFLDPRAEQEIRFLRAELEAANDLWRQLDAIHLNLGEILPNA